MEKSGARVYLRVCCDGGVEGVIRRSGGDGGRGSRGGGGGSGGGGGGSTHVKGK